MANINAAIPKTYSIVVPNRFATSDGESVTKRFVQIPSHNLTDTAAIAVSNSTSRIEKLNQRRFGLVSVMAVPHATAKGSVYRGGFVPGNGSAANPGVE